METLTVSSDDAQAIRGMLAQHQLNWRERRSWLLWRRFEVDGEDLQRFMAEYDQWCRDRDLGRAW